MPLKITFGAELEADVDRSEAAVTFQCFDEQNPQGATAVSGTVRLAKRSASENDQAFQGRVRAAAAHALGLMQQALNAGEGDFPSKLPKQQPDPKT